MNNRMTAVSEQLYNQAISNSLTIAEAVGFLEKESRIRTLREKLEKFSRGRDLRTILVRGLDRKSVV